MWGYAAIAAAGAATAFYLKKRKTTTNKIRIVSATITNRDTIVAYVDSTNRTKAAYYDSGNWYDTKTHGSLPAHVTSQLDEHVSKAVIKTATNAAKANPTATPLLGTKDDWWKGSKFD